MKCFNCGAVLKTTDYCSHCGADVKLYRRMLQLSNAYYNEGLAKANLYCWGSGESCWQYVDAEYFEVYAGRRHLREARRGACFGR